MLRICTGMKPGIFHRHFFLLLKLVQKALKMGKMEGIVMPLNTILFGGLNSTIRGGGFKPLNHPFGYIPEFINILQTKNYQ
jgi:hypothetical protein